MHRVSQAREKRRRKQERKEVECSKTHDSKGKNKQTEKKPWYIQGTTFLFRMAGHA